ncbi:hypothetical protein H0H93_000121 [Arthromyces matolae]|nr:hypothetical protein H0H93_000121 [Arthromyces matolae]
MAPETSTGIEQRIEQREAARRHPLQTIPVATHEPLGNIPNTPLAVSTIAFILGGIFTLGILMFLNGGFDYWWATAQLGFFIAAWAAFHWGEFAVTAGWNLEKCSVDSYLLDNGAMYHIANGTAVLEYILTLYFNPSLKAFPYLSLFGPYFLHIHVLLDDGNGVSGILFVVLGQFLRSAAMIHAATNFSHSLAFQKRDNHRLVTDGVYAWFRHPSYAGFFYWAVGTQLVLQNPLSFVLFVILLWRFFYYRTRAEEKALVKFFGDAYVDYRRRVGTKIPFVP